jgi:hypothetical protein
MISSKTQMLFSTSAVRRLLGVASGLKVRIQEWFKVVWVCVEGKRPTLISKKTFLLHFVEWRKAQSRSLQVTKNIVRADLFTVRNETKGSTYKVQCFTGGVMCDCEDFKNQSAFLGRACCKHCYAVLGHLGFSSLSAYIEASTASLAA